MIHTIIVEDDPMVAQINCQYLQRLEDFQVDAVFGSGKAALDYVRGNSADLLILDVYMPGLSGLELLYQIRTEHIRLSVIMVTAAIEMETVEEALRLGIVDYLIKPFSFQRFQEAIEKYLLKMNLLKTCQTANQTVVDQLMHTSFSHDKESKELRKGLRSVQGYGPALSQLSDRSRPGRQLHRLRDGRPPPGALSAPVDFFAFESVSFAKETAASHL